MIESDCAKFDEEEFVISYLKKRIDVINVTWDDSALRNVEPFIKKLIEMNKIAQIMQKKEC